MADSSASVPGPAEPKDGPPHGSGDGSSDLGEQPAPQEICILKGVGSGLSGALVGSVFGIGSGVFKKPRSFKSVMAEGGSSAKTFAIMSGVHTAVVCLLRKVRQRDDPLHAGIAGCVTGLALGWGGTPQAILQSCATFGAISYIFELMNPAPAIALTRVEGRRAPPQRSRKAGRLSLQNAFLDFPALPALPPFTLPSPHPLDLRFLGGLSAACRQGHSHLVECLQRPAEGRGR